MSWRRLSVLLAVLAVLCLGTPAHAQEVADLAIAVTASADVVGVGDSFTYTLFVVNSGPGVAADVQVRDTLTPNVSVAGVTASAGACVADALTVSCSLGALSSSLASPPVTIAITVIATGAGDATSVAVVSSTTPDPNPANNTGAVAVVAVVTLPRQADLAITKTASAAQVVVGDDFTYTLTVTNGGPSTVPQIHLTDVMPAQVTFVSTTHPNTVGCVLLLNVVFDCVGGPLAGGQSVAITATVHTVSSGQITNTATVTSATPDPVPGNNNATAVVSARDKQADLAITKTASTALVTVGDTFTYTLTVTNNGPDTVPSAHVVDVLPAQVTFVSTTHANTVVCGLLLNVVFDCAGGPLASGQSFVITATVQAVGAGLITNTATVTSVLQDPVPANNSATELVFARTPRQPLADVAITKTASVAQISVGSDFTYTLTITNLGPDTAQGVHLTDVMPPEVTFVSTTHPNTVSCGLFLKVVFDCAGGPLAGGQSIVITATVHTVASGQITNTANVTGTTADPVPGNNSATAVVSAHELGISDLVLQVHGISLDRGTATSLIAKLNAASDNLDAGDVAGACGALGAFGNEVQAQSGKKLTVNQAQTLGENATAVQATIGCR